MGLHLANLVFIVVLASVIIGCAHQPAADYSGNDYQEIACDSADSRSFPVKGNDVNLCSNQEHYHYNHDYYSKK